MITTLATVTTVYRTTFDIHPDRTVIVYKDGCNVPISVRHFRDAAARDAHVADEQHVNRLLAHVTYRYEVR